MLVNERTNNQQVVGYQLTIHLDKDIKIEEKEIFSISNQPHFVACNLTKGRVDFENGWVLKKMQPSFKT